MGALHGPVVNGVVHINQRVKFNSEVQAGLNNPWSDVWFVDGDDGDIGFNGRGPSQSKANLSEAVGLVTDNDVIKVKAADYTEESAIVLSNNDVHIQGLAPTQYQPHLDIWMAKATTISPLMTVSGRGNVMSNICFRYGSETAVDSGTGYATDLTCMLVSGRYNHFENVYFYSPLFAEQDVAATYKGVRITGHNNYFKGCRFGNDGLERDQANFDLEVSGIGNVFEDCTFHMLAGNTAPFFVYINSGTRDMRHTLFKNCTFYAHSANYGSTPAYAFKTNYGANTCAVIIDSRCNFVNVAQISDTNDDVWIWKENIKGEYGADTAKISGIALRNQGV